MQSRSEDVAMLASMHKESAAVLQTQLPTEQGDLIIRKTLPKLSQAVRPLIHVVKLLDLHLRQTIIACKLENFAAQTHRASV